MDKFDEMMGRAMTEEDRALLARHAEPGYVAQAFGLFRGPQSWVMWVTNIAAGASFIGGLALFWGMLQTTSPVDAVQLGVGALFLFQVTVMCKTFMGQRLESNRLLREIKRLELQVSLQAARGGK